MWCLFSLVVAALIYHHTPNVTVYALNDATFECSAIGLPRPTIKWYKQLQNGTLQPITGTAISSTATGVQNLTSYFTISSAVLSDAGSYVCQAISAGSSSTSSAILTVLGRNALLLLLF